MIRRTGRCRRFDCDAMAAGVAAAEARAVSGFSLSAISWVMASIWFFREYDVCVHHPLCLLPGHASPHLQLTPIPHPHTVALTSSGMTGG